MVGGTLLRAAVVWACAVAATPKSHTPERTSVRRRFDMTKLLSGWRFRTIYYDANEMPQAGAARCVPPCSGLADDSGRGRAGALDRPRVRCGAGTVPQAICGRAERSHGRTD